jgi:hypothetical protein
LDALNAGRSEIEQPRFDPEARLGFERNTGFDAVAFIVAAAP